MAAPTLLCARGTLLVAGRAPDGDSVRFVPDTPRLLDRLRRSWRLRRSTQDGSVQLRLDGIDAPELSYADLAQPYGPRSRDALLARCGFTDVELDGDRVVSAEPGSRPAAILAGLADPNGRPVSFLVVGDLPPDGEYVPIDDALVDRTVNAELLAGGMAYPTFYEATPAPVRERLREVARFAREAGGGLWRIDRSAEFTLDGLGSLTGPRGQLVLPKLFRRCVEYLRDPDAVARMTLPQWLARSSPSGRTLDDLVLERGAAAPVPFSELVEQDGDVVRLTADPLDLVIVEG